MKENFDFNHLKDAADSGERDAAFRLAECYENGRGVTKSAVRAAYYYGLASDLGLRRADFKLGQCYLIGFGVDRNRERAKHHFYRAGESGIAEAYTELGRLAETDEKRKLVAIDTNTNSEELQTNSKVLSECARLYRLAAEGGDAEGAYRYSEILKTDPQHSEERKYWFEVSEEKGHAGSAFELGKLAEKREEYEKALLYYLKAAKCGVSVASLACGRCYEKGIGCKKDAKSAFSFYDDAFRNGQTEASFPLAKFYFEGIVVVQNIEQAKKYLNVAIDTNISQAMTFAGRMTEHGTYGTRQDETRAAEYYRRAAELGDADGKALYGKMLILGIGDRADYDEAYRWISDAAKHGSCYGTYYLAYCREKGFGTNIDFNAAIELYRAAAKQNVSDAEERIKLLEERLRCKH